MVTAKDKDAGIKAKILCAQILEEVSSFEYTNVKEEFGYIRSDGYFSHGHHVAYYLGEHPNFPKSGCSFSIMYNGARYVEGISIDDLDMTAKVKNKERL